MLTALAQSGPAPAEFGWWLASRAAGIAALLCITVSVGIGLAMAGRLARGPLAAKAMAIHQQTALAGLVAIAVHGITLLGDGFLHPSIGDIAIPFTSDHAPLWTGLGVTGGWLGAALGLTYWLRDRIGPARWRKLHRATILVYVLAVAHTLGAGSDAGQPWLIALLLLTGAPVLFLFVMRVLTPRPAPAFRPVRVAAITPESSDVLSFTLVPVGRKRTPLPPYEAGQFTTVRAGGLSRSYSLSSAPGGDAWRISVKRDGAMSEHLHTAVAVGDTLEAGRPGGRFVLDGSQRPVVLLSAGIGATPVLAMLGALAAARSQREVWWIHGARRRAEHAFRDEALDLVARLPRGHHHVRLSRPDPWDEAPATGRLTADVVLDELGVPHDAAFHLCGTPAFVGDLTDGLRAAGIPADRIRSESFGGAAAPTPSVQEEPLPAHAVAFARSDVTTSWDHGFASLLDLAEAHDVPATPGCRVGSCHSCRTPILAGSVQHHPEPLEPPPVGSALLCCARPDGDLVLDV